MDKPDAIGDMEKQLRDAQDQLGHLRSEIEKAKALQEDRILGSLSSIAGQKLTKEDVESTEQERERCEYCSAMSDLHAVSECMDKCSKRMFVLNEETEKTYPENVIALRNDLRLMKALSELMTGAPAAFDGQSPGHLLRLFSMPLTTRLLSRSRWIRFWIWLESEPGEVSDDTRLAIGSPSPDANRRKRWLSLFHERRQFSRFTDERQFMHSTYLEAMRMMATECANSSKAASEDQIQAADARSAFVDRAKRAEKTRQCKIVSSRAVDVARQVPHKEEPVANALKGMTHTELVM